jgi:hypothetical protein
MDAVGPLPPAPAQNQHCLDRCDARSMAELGHLQRIDSTGAVSGPPPIATDWRAAIRAAVRSDGLKQTQLSDDKYVVHQMGAFASF